MIMTRTAFKSLLHKCSENTDEPPWAGGELAFQEQWCRLTSGHHQVNSDGNNAVLAETDRLGHFTSIDATKFRKEAGETTQFYTQVPDAFSRV